MKISIAILLSILTIKTSLQSAYCGEGCMECNILSPDSGCTKCFRRYLSGASTCGPEDLDDHCDIYSIYPINACDLCSSGYSQQFTFGPCMPVYNKIYNCAFYGPFSCKICDNGVPEATSRKACIPFPDTPGFKNCLWGGTYGSGQHYCERCAEGYAIAGTGCDPTNVEGCLRLQDGNCSHCDPWSGYASSTGYPVTKCDKMRTRSTGGSLAGVLGRD